VIAVRQLTIDEIGVVADIDRSEHIDLMYSVVDGRLTERAVVDLMYSVVAGRLTERAVDEDSPPWDPVGDGEHSVARHVQECTELVAGGATAFGAFDGTRTAGVAIVDPHFEPGRAWLAFFHVSSAHRRQGVGRALWDAAADLARAAGADELYISATPTGSAVGFYVRQGSRLADPVHPALFATEPEDIRLVCPLR
jgi:ribosomal protein S18 acetylase RimI-like enzyme